MMPCLFCGPPIGMAHWAVTSLVSADLGTKKTRGTPHTQAVLPHRSWPEHFPKLVYFFTVCAVLFFITVFFIYSAV